MSAIKQIENPSKLSRFAGVSEANAEREPAGEILSPQFGEGSSGGGSRFQAAGAQEIPVAEWPAFCEWFTANFRGIATSIERHEGGDDLPAVCRDLPLVGVKAHQLENRVPAISVTVQGKPRNILLDITGPQRMVLHWNAAGWPTRLEVSYETGEVVVQFAGELEPVRGISANTWGE